mmetsp:Transcript_63871/g.198258  ORF Transcript_63871/g.198258 Transcript_63871/m.198258 type:complete len:248 (-) Transcript_63871:307-1050(-)
MCLHLPLKHRQAHVGKLPGQAAQAEITAATCTPERQRSVQLIATAGTQRAAHGQDRVRHAVPIAAVATVLLCCSPQGCCCRLDPSTEVLPLHARPLHGALQQLVIILLLDRGLLHAATALPLPRPALQHPCSPAPAEEQHAPRIVKSQPLAVAPLKLGRSLATTQSHLGFLPDLRRQLPGLVSRSPPEALRSGRLPLQCSRRAISPFTLVLLLHLLVHGLRRLLACGLLLVPPPGQHHLRPRVTRLR